MSVPEIITLPPAPSTLSEDILNGLTKDPHNRTLPTMLLYDEKGLRLYDDITTQVHEYYLFPAEESILKEKSDEIVLAMCGTQRVDGETVLELGAGALRKTSHLLKALARSAPAKSEPITYYALDLEHRELVRTLTPLVASTGIGAELANKVNIKGICGRYEEGFKLLREGRLPMSTGHQESKERVPSAFPRSNSPSNTLSPSSDASTLSTPSETPSTAASSLPSLRTDALDLDSSGPPLHFLFLGSSIGNFTRQGAAEFLRALPLRPSSGTEPGDTLLIGIDHKNEKDVVELAYNDPRDVSRKFILNGLTVANRALSSGDGDVFKSDNWDFYGFYNEKEGRHEGNYKSKVDQEITIAVGRQTRSFTFAKDELINVEYSYKYDDSDVRTLFLLSNLRAIQRWTSNNGLYSLWLVHRPPFQFPIISSPSRVSPRALLSPLTQSTVVSYPDNVASSTYPTIPTMAEWKQIWAAWDTITLGMIPPEMMHQKPIDLRHKCLFYLGHIPTFLDIHLSRLLKEPHTEPEEYKYIFERGIDPHVDDPTQCHPHSEVPNTDDKWPSLEALVAFRDRVRARLLKVYADEALDGGANKPRTRPNIPIAKVARVLWMTYEHEAMHAETLLYMLMQRAGTGTLPPPGFPKPNFESLAKQWDAQIANEPRTDPTLTLGPAEVWLGHDDIEANDANRDLSAHHEYGWDNESPRWKENVGKFKIEKKPITNGEYYKFWKSREAGNRALPASWVQMSDSDEVQVRTFYGPVPMHIAHHWPFVSSYDDISAYAIVKGGRLPTEAELRLFKDLQESAEGGEGATWGFGEWHYVPPSLGENGLTPHNGGVWEWTSTLLDKHEGFVPSTLYPGYSADFHDGVHHVVLGGSFATIPRLAQRRSLRNWYQHNYPYAFIGGRLVYNAE